MRIAMDLLTAEVRAERRPWGVVAELAESPKLPPGRASPALWPPGLSPPPPVLESLPETCLSQDLCSVRVCSTVSVRECGCPVPGPAGL